MLELRGYGRLKGRYGLRLQCDSFRVVSRETNGDMESCRPFDLKLVSVVLEALGRLLPTFNFGFAKSLFFSLRFLELEPIVLGPLEVGDVK